MGRKSQRDERRAQILEAFARVLADHGYAGATITAVADTAGMAPGLLHHHFSSKQEMLEQLVNLLIRKFRQRFQALNSKDASLESYIDCALKLDHQADTISAKCWVGVLAEALRDQTLFNKIRRHLESEVEEIRLLSDGKLDSGESGAVLAYIFGSLVFGAFAPRKTAGFAAENGKLLVSTLLTK